MASKWPGLIANAERLLGGPAPFINLDLLISSEASFLASRARRVASNVDHPFFDTIRAYLRGKTVKTPFLSLPSKVVPYPNVSYSPTRASGGLITLLLGQCCAGQQASCVKLCGQHRKVAEIFETVNLAISIHKSLVFPEKKSLSDCANHSHANMVKHLEAGNKVATLAGDVLLATVSSSLAAFHNSEVVDVVSEAMGDMLEAEYCPLALHFHHGPSTSSKQPLTQPTTGSQSDPDFTRLWLDYIGLARGSLLGACCNSTVLLSHPGEDRAAQALSLIARQLGHSWATLVRLLDEREFARRLFEADNCAISPQRERVPFKENGLPEPTLLDAFDLQSELPVPCDLVLEHYHSIATRLIRDLHGAFHNLRAAVEHMASNERACASALTTLGDLVNHVAQEATA